MSERGAGEPVNTIESVDNALRVLLMFVDRDRLGVAEAGREIGVARSTAHRLLAMLQHHRFVMQDPLTRAYVRGPALIDVGLATVRDMDIRAHARPVLEALATVTQETVHLLAREGAEVRFLDCVEGPRAVRVGCRTGTQMPAHCTAAGKALLASLAPDELARLYPSERLRRMTSSSIAHRSRLRSELDSVRRQGYAVSLGEAEEEVASVAGVVAANDGRPQAAISVAGPLSRMPASRVQELAEAVMEAAAEIALGTA